MREKVSESCCEMFPVQRYLKKHFPELFSQNCDILSLSFEAYYFILKRKNMIINGQLSDDEGGERISAFLVKMIFLFVS